ncbi:TPR repeat domain-containing protein [Chloropicon primus]|nr:TPR repeat domain-containing protein [Chloropicon primus]
MGSSREVVALAEHADGRWLARREERESKRRDKEDHHHRNVWTKEPHGGRYRVSTGPAARVGYDALEERPDGTKVEPDAGYEKPQAGLTSNFVGNHMTQGAIDLVQGSLTRKDRGYETEKLKRYQRTYHPPKLVSRGEDAGEKLASEPRSLVVERYRWWDAGARVVVEAGLYGESDGSGQGHVTVSEAFTSEGFCVTVVGEGEEASRVLKVPRLFKPIVPERSTCRTRNQGDRRKGLLVVSLQKEDEAVEWTDLRETAAESRTRAIAATAGGGVVASQSPPDLAVLRKAIRQQRKNKKPGDGLLFADLEKVKAGVQEERTKCQEEEEGLDHEIRAELMDCTTEELDFKLCELLELGDYGKALRCCGYALSVIDNANFEKKSHLLLQRSTCYSQLGDVKKACKDAEECRSMRVKTQEQEVLLTLAKLYEQGEDYEKAMGAVQNLSQVQPSHPSLGIMRSRIRRAMQQESRRKEEEAQQSDGSSGLLPSVPRPVLSKFENKGKSGAVF